MDVLVFLANAAFLPCKILTDGLESCVLVDYCDDFISCLDFNSESTYSLRRIHW